MEYFGSHNHTGSSNFKLKDSINKVEDLLDYALEMNLSGIAITDHETICSHIKALKYCKEEKFKDFKLGLGNEIYLVDRTEVNQLRTNNLKVDFYHFILIAKDAIGHKQIRRLSSLAWDNSFYYRSAGLRVPTYKDDLEKIISEDPGHLIACTACAGGELPTLIIRDQKAEAVKFINWALELFGDDFYLELQPTDTELEREEKIRLLKEDENYIDNKADQKKVNTALLKISEKLKIPFIITTDSHYLNKEKTLAHETYLTSSEGDREVSAFYSTCYIMGKDELLEYFDDSVYQQAKINSKKLALKITKYDLKHEQVVPKFEIPPYIPCDILNDQSNNFAYMKKYKNSELKIDRYYYHLVSMGLYEKKIELTKIVLDRLEIEFKECWLISEKLEQPLSEYFVLTKDIVDIMWEISLVGVSRGSAACFYLNYLLDIVQIDPLKYDLPHWRFASHEKVELADIDLDSESAKRQDIIQLVKNKYGRSRVLNLGTVNTEATNGAIRTACRGLKIDNDIAGALTKMVPSDKAGAWSMTDILNGNAEEGRKPAKSFIKEISNYPGLFETLSSIEGVISGNGQHASGVVIYPDDYNNYTAMMKTSGGLEVTQYTAYDAEYCGALKLDFLSITALDRIRATMELLIEYGVIEWQGSLRATYNKYLHPDVLELNDPEMYKMLYTGQLFSPFQYETALGQQVLKKLKATDFNILCAGNNLMRLSSSGEQPLDRFIRFKNDISLWYKEMIEDGLNEEEIEVLKIQLSATFGCCDCQESLMMLAMDHKISKFTLGMANKLRKSVAKQDHDAQIEQWLIFSENCKKTGTSDKMRDYVWIKCFTPQFAYAFSRPHTAGYTLVLLQELNLAFRFGAKFWQSSVLSIDAGIIGEEAKGGTSYGKISKAVSTLKGIVQPLDINNSMTAFVPDKELDKIYYSFKAVSGLNAIDADIIIENRPYESLEDFYEKIIDGKLMPISKMITLIKTGAFDNITDLDRKSQMKKMTELFVKNREKLTIVNAQIVIDMYPEQLKEIAEIIELKKRLFGKRKKGEFYDTKEDFLRICGKGVSFTFDNYGNLVVDPKSFNKFFESKAVDLRLLLNNEVVLSEYVRQKRIEFWIQNCFGSIESWEMESLNNYFGNHELDKLQFINEMFSVSSFDNLNPETEIASWKHKNGLRIPVPKIHTITGTVIEKQKGKNFVYILDQNKEVVQVRYYKGQFINFDEKVVEVIGGEKQVLDRSWFTRGNILIINGFRRGDEFVANNGTIFESSTYLVDKKNKSIRGKKNRSNVE